MRNWILNFLRNSVKTEWKLFGIEILCLIFDQEIFIAITNRK